LSFDGNESGRSRNENRSQQLHRLGMLEDEYETEELKKLLNEERQYNSKAF